MKKSTKLIKKYGWQKALKKGFVKIGGRGKVIEAVLTKRGRKHKL